MEVRVAEAQSEVHGTSSRQAIVVGAGITGLAAALALAARGVQVTILEQDPPPESADSEDAFLRWDRGGVAHIRHSHVFLGRLRNLLRERYPEILAALLAAGVREYRLMDNPPLTLTGLAPEPEDENLVTLGCRRTTFEWVLRSKVLELPLVGLRSGVKVTSLLADRAAGPVPSVTGVRFRVGTQPEESLTAELVVDASGRRSDCVAWLGALGARPVFETTENSGIVYYTRYYRLRDGAKEPPRTIHPTAADWNWVKYAVFPADQNTFSITLAAPLAFPRMKVLAKAPAFDAMVRRIPGIAPWVDPTVSEPIRGLEREVQAMGGLINRLRRFVDEHGALTHNFFVLGDAAYCSNPLYGRGCAQGFLHAEILAEAVRAHWGDPEAIAQALDRRSREELEPFFRASVLADRDAVRKAEGRLPKSIAGRLRARFFEEGLLIATRCDPVVFRAFIRMMNMLETPDQAFSRPEIVLRTLWIWLRGESWNRPYLLPPAPDREATLRELEAAAA